MLDTGVGSFAAAAPARAPAATERAAALLTVDSAVLNIFWELASVQAAKREARRSARAEPYGRR